MWIREVVAVLYREKRGHASPEHAHRRHRPERHKRDQQESQDSQFDFIHIAFPGGSNSYNAT